MTTKYKIRFDNITLTKDEDGDLEVEFTAPFNDDKHYTYLDAKNVHSLVLWLIAKFGEPPTEGWTKGE